MTHPVPSPQRPPHQLSACDALFEDRGSAALVLERAIAEYKLLEELPDGAPPLAAAAARFLTQQVVDQIVDLLSRLPLGDMLTEWWSQLQQVVEAQLATRTDGGSRNVSLFEHELTLTQEPTIELLVDEVPVPLLTLTLEINFSVTGCDLLVVAGEITGAQPGPIGVAGSLRSGAVILVEHAIHDIDLARLFIDQASAIGAT